MDYVSNDGRLASRLDWCLAQKIRPDLKMMLVLLAAHGRVDCIALEDLAQRFPASIHRTKDLLTELVGKALIELRPAPATWIEYEIRVPA